VPRHALYRAIAAVPKLIISQVFWFCHPWRKLLHNVMQYSAEGCTKIKAPKSHLRVNVVH
jgi:hypothetical protein